MRRESTFFHHFLTSVASIYNLRPNLLNMFFTPLKAVLINPVYIFFTVLFIFIHLFLAV